MSVKIVGPRVLATSAATLLNNANQASFSFRFKIDPAAAAFSSGTLLFGRSDGKGFALVATTSYGAPAVRFTVYGASGSSITQAINYVPGRAYHLAATWDATNKAQTIYLDGRAATTAAIASPVQPAGASSTVQIGSTGQAASATFSIDDCWLWSGAVLSASEVLALRDRTAAPASLHPGTLVWGTALDGPEGAAVAAGDPGLVDQAAGLNLTPSGTGSAAWSADSLGFVPSIATAPRVLTSGKTIAFFFNDSVTGDLVFTDTLTANPTISINGGAPTALSNPVFTTDGNSLPYALYAMPVPVTSTDAVTYSAVEAWASRTTPASTSQPVLATGAAVGAAVVNGVGRPNVDTPTPTMDLAWNLASPAYWTVSRQSRNLVRTANLWRNATAFDPDGKPTAGTNLAFAIPTAQLPNQIDALKHVAPASIPWMPHNPDYHTVVWSESDPANNTVVTMSGSSGRSTAAEVVELAENPPGGIRRKRVFKVTRADNPTDYTLGATVNFSRTDWTDLYVFGPGNAVDYDDVVDEVLKQYVAGAKVVRFMDQTRTNNSPVATRAHLRPPTDFNSSVDRPQWVTLQEIGPVDDVTQFSFSTGWMAAKFTTAEPHGFYTGQFVWFSNCFNTGVVINLTLAAAATAATTTLSLSDASAVERNDYLHVESEWLLVLAVSGSNVTVTRGTRNSTAAAHASGTAVQLYKQGAVASDGVTSASMGDAYGTPCYVTSPTTFEGMLYHGNKSLGPSTVNALATPQTFDPASRVGFPSTTVGICFEDIFRTASSMGVDAWICVPFAATDDCVAAIAEKARDYLAPGLKVWVEYSNEIWNYAFAYSGQSLGALIQGKKRTPRISYVQQGALGAAHVHDIFANVLGAAGRGDDLVRVISYQWASPGGSESLISFCAANSIKIDAYAVAPYLDLPKTLAAAVDGYDSDQLHDFWQLLLAYNYPAESSLPGAYLPRHSAALKAAYPDARLVCYEGSMEGLLWSGDGTYPANTDIERRTHDLVYHPAMHATFTAYLASLQNGGVSLFAHYLLTHASGWQYHQGGWNVYFWHGQPWGYGDGSDGKADNLKCLATTKPANVQQDFQNVSVAGQAWKDWAAALPDKRFIVPPLAAAAVLTPQRAATDHSPEVGSLLGVTRLARAFATVNVVPTASPLAASASLAAASASTTLVLTTSAMGNAGTAAGATVVTKFSANPNTLGFLRNAEPLATLAGRSITAGLDFFTASEPYSTVSQIVVANLAVPAAPIHSTVEAALAATVGDRFVSPPVLIGDGRTGSTTIDAVASISADAFATPWASAATLTSASLGLDWSSGVGPVAGDGLLGGAATATSFQVVAGLLPAAGTLGTSVGFSPAPSRLNDLGCFRRGEPEFGLAGKVPTTGFDYFIRGEPIRSATTAAAASGDSLATAPTFALFGVTSMATLLADARLQTVDLGSPAEMGAPVAMTSNNAPPSVLPLAGSGTFAGGRVPSHRHRFAKPYIFPRRHRHR
jgi:hypothetical protein